MSDNEYNSLDEEGSDFSDEFDDLIADYKPRDFTAAEQMLQFIFASFLSALPIYLYFSLYDMDIVDNALMFGPITVMSTVLLITAYKNIASGSNATLSNARKLLTDNSNHKALGYTKEQLDTLQEDMTARESIVWSFFVVNLFFTVLFLFTAFYALTAVPPTYNYSISVSTSAVLAWYISTTLK